MASNSEDFIPFSCSTPLRQGGESWSQRHRGNFRSRPQFNNTWTGRSPRHNNSSSRYNSTFNNCNKRNTSQITDISAYLSPAMLQDPWEYLKNRDASFTNSQIETSKLTYEESVTQMPGNTPHSFNSMPSSSFGQTTESSCQK